MNLSEIKYLILFFPPFQSSFGPAVQPFFGRFKRGFFFPIHSPSSPSLQSCCLCSANHHRQSGAATATALRMPSHRRHRLLLLLLLPTLLLQLLMFESRGRHVLVVVVVGGVGVGSCPDGTGGSSAAHLFKYACICIALLSYYIV